MATLTEHIQTAEDVLPEQFKSIAAELSREPVHRWTAYIQCRGRGTVLPPEQDLAKGVFAKAYVNHGRWVVDCPAPGCGNAQMAWISDKRFLCSDCLNVMQDGRPLHVVWPEDRKRQAMEEVLLARLFPARRNWTGRETVADLIRENERYPDQVRRR